MIIERKVKHFTGLLFVLRICCLKIINGSLLRDIEFWLLYFDFKMDFFRDATKFF